MQSLIFKFKLLFIQIRNFKLSQCAAPDDFAIIPAMKIRRLRLLLLALFLLALSGEALHTLSAHHDASHCSVCSFQSHNLGTDSHADSGMADLFIIHETPLPQTGLPCRLTAARTFLGRAPPFLYA
jgi:hypothetical protein